MKKFISVLLILTLYASLTLTIYADNNSAKPASKASITDISGRNDEAIIKEIVTTGIMSTTKCKFLPEKSITRSEFVVIIHKALGISIQYFMAPDITKVFSDVKNTDLYAGDLIDLVTTNIIDFKGQFKPKSTITREEMIHYIMNGYNYKMNGEESLQVLDDKAFSKFTDSNKISAAFLNDVKNAAALRIAKAKSKNMFSPKSKATRADVAVFLHGLLNSITFKASNVSIVPSYVKDVNTFKMELTITNKLKTNITINHSSGQKYDFVLLDSENKEMYRWSMGIFFIQSTSSTIVKAGKSVKYYVSLDLSSKGDLIAKAKYMKAFIVGQSSNFKINAEGYEIAIV